MAAQAQWEEEQDRISVYLLPADPESGQPYVNLRYYSGNPVGHFWLSRNPDGGEEKVKYDCFVPSVLMDGTETLTWTHPDGRARDRSDTGEAGCKVSITHTDQAIALSFDVDLLKEEGGRSGGHGGGGGAGSEEGDQEVRVHATGSATIALQPRG